MHAQLALHNPHNPAGPHIFASLPKVQLEILRGQAQCKVRQVEGPVFLIGCAQDCDLVLGDPQFPAVHTYLFVTNSRVIIRHLGADPKLEVEGHVVKSTELRNGDHIRTGPFEFLVQIEVRKSAMNEAAVLSSRDSTNRDQVGSEADFVAAKTLIRDIRARMLLNDKQGADHSVTDKRKLDSFGDHLEVPRRAVA